MSSSIRTMQQATPRRDFLARRILAHLDIPEPTTRQIATMKGLLRDRGLVLPTEAVYIKELTEKEEAILFWTARGKTALQIAKLLNIAPSTAKTYRHLIKRKLNAHTIAQAVYEALRFHILWRDESGKNEGAHRAPETDGSADYS